MKKFPDFVPPTKVSYLDRGPTLHLRRCMLEAFDDREAQIAGNQNFRKRLSMVPNVLTHGSPDFQRVAETLRDQKPNFRTLLIQQRVCSDGRAMNKQLSVGKEGFDVDCQGTGRQPNRR